MIYIFSCYRKDMQGNKEVHAFMKVPRHVDLIKVAEHELFNVDMTGIDNMLSSIEEQMKGEDSVVFWEQHNHICQVMKIELHDNRTVRMISSLREAVEKARGGPAPIPLQRFA